MGFGRFLKKKFIPGYDLLNTVEHVANEGLVDGLKSKVKEDYCEDMPGTSHLYKSGKYDGKKEGIEEASSIYEKKLLKQAEEFLEQQKDAQKELTAYRKLLDEYEKEIEKLENKANKTKEENAYLQKLLLTERKLRKLN